MKSRIKFNREVTPGEMTGGKALPKLSRTLVKGLTSRNGQAKYVYT